MEVITMTLHMDDFVASWLVLNRLITYPEDCH